MYLLPKRNKNYQFGPKMRKRGKDQSFRDIYCQGEAFRRFLLTSALIEAQVSFHKELNQVTLLSNSLCLGQGIKT